MIPLLLLNKILQLFLVMLLGFILVKTKIVKSSDSLVLSKTCLYLLMPSVIINAFDIEMTNDILSGIMLAFLAAILVHIALFIIDAISKKFGVLGVERASIMYSNAGNLVIPIVSFVLGEEWVVYTCAFLSVQLFFLWTHGIGLFSNDKKFNFKKIFLNINIIAIVVGVLMMIFGIRLPSMLKDVASSLGSMVGNVGMLIAGMLAAEVDFKNMLLNKRIYLVLAMKMVICPLVVLIILKILGIALPIANAKNILLISFIAAMTPPAATVMQFAQIHEKDADFAVAANIFATLVCIITMPVFVALFVM